MLHSTLNRLLACAAAALLPLLPSLAAAQVKPALVRDVSTAQPVRGYCSKSDISTPGVAKCALYVVPAGKRLVVEAVSYKIYLDSAFQVTELLFGRDDCTSCSNMLFDTEVREINPTQIFNPSNRVYVGSESTRLYIEENDTFAVMLYTQAGSAHYSQQFNFSGYLVDK
jgi:hypothetical protein